MYTRRPLPTRSLLHPCHATNATPRSSWSMPKPGPATQLRCVNALGRRGEQQRHHGATQRNGLKVNHSPARPPPRPSMVCFSGTEQRSPEQTANGKISAHACHHCHVAPMETVSRCRSPVHNNVISKSLTWFSKRPASLTRRTSKTHDLRRVTWSSWCKHLKPGTSLAKVHTCRTWSMKRSLNCSRNEFSGRPFIGHV